MERVEKIAFIDGDDIAWISDPRMEIAAQAARAVTGMLDIPSKKIGEYPRLIDAGMVTLRKVVVEGKEDQDFWERADVQGDYGPELHEDEYCYEDVARWNRVFYRVAFQPDLLALDIPAPRALEHMATLVKAGYVIWILTSNPATTHESRLAWMARHHFDLLACSIGEGGHLVPNLITKPMDKQFTRTTTWKAETTVDMVRNLGARKVVAVDDASANLDALHEHEYWQGDGFNVHLYSATCLDLAAGHVAFQCDSEA